VKTVLNVTILVNNVKFKQEIVKSVKNSEYPLLSIVRNVFVKKVSLSLLKESVFLVTINVFLV
jgi:hypothetical protein